MTWMDVKMATFPLAAALQGDSDSSASKKTAEPCRLEYVRMVIGEPRLGPHPILGQVRGVQGHRG